MALAFNAGAFEKKYTPELLEAFEKIEIQKKESGYEILHFSYFHGSCGAITNYDDITQWFYGYSSCDVIYNFLYSDKKVILDKYYTALNLNCSFETQTCEWQVL